MATSAQAFNAGAGNTEFGITHPSLIAMCLASFDVFDTCLSRSVARSTDLFYLLGQEALQRGLIIDSAQTFHDLRQRAERLARSSSLSNEPSIDGIYAHLGSITGWNHHTTVQVKRLELELEARCIVPVTATRRIVDQARQAKCRIIFLSDMYLPTVFVRDLLHKHGFLQPGDEVVVSGDTGYSKRSGRAFAAIRRGLSESTEWIHFGDSWRADLLIPRLHGIRATRVAEATLNRYELGTLRRTSHSASRLSIAGAMRATRVSMPEMYLDRQAIWSVGSDVVGPLLFGFVLWCLQTAKAQGLNRLFFISRDGQILHRIAERIATKWDFPIECRYLYGSRQAWHSASIGSVGARDLEWILHRATRVTVSEILARVGMTVSEVSSELRALGFHEARYETTLSREDVRTLAQGVLNGPLTKPVEETAAARRKLVLAYLKQEGVLSPKSYAIVDVGWFGNLQMSLAKLLDSVGARPTGGPKGLFLGLHSDRIDSAAAGELSSYWEFCGMSSRTLRLYNLALFEIFCAADHGSVVGFVTADGLVKPIFAEPANTRALEWGLIPLQQSILGFTATLLDNGAADAFSLEAHRASVANFRLFHDRPTKSEALAWGRYSFSDSQVEGRFHDIVPDWTCGRVVRALWNRREQPYGWWHQGSLAVRTCLPLGVYVVMLRLAMWAMRYALPERAYSWTVGQLRRIG